MTRTTFAAAIVLGLLSGASAAQEPPPAPPEGARPDAPAAPDSQAERQKNNAAKLAGLVGFVRINCPDLAPDDARFRSVLAGLGVPYESLEAGDLHLRALAYTEIYGKDIPANCARAIENFGANGRTIPGLVVKR